MAIVDEDGDHFAVDDDHETGLCLDDLTSHDPHPAPIKLAVFNGIHRYVSFSCHRNIPR